MFNKKLKKLYAGALALSMVLAAAPLGASATAPNKEVNTDMKGSHIKEGDDDTEETTARLGLDPTNVSATGAALDVDGNPLDAEGSGIGTDIDVWGHTEDGTVYSVDVEWGAMTFQYETSSWDPETHMAKTGAGWVVYDSVNEKKLGDVQDAINRITITNHSNAAVYAGLSYAAATDAEDYSDISGSFAASEKAATEDFGATFDADTDYLTLETADNSTDKDQPGTPTVGNIYFKPVDISEDHKTNGITKWTKIGVITVGLEIEDPSATPETP